MVSVSVFTPNVWVFGRLLIVRLLYSVVRMDGVTHVIGSLGACVDERVRSAMTTRLSSRSSANANRSKSINVLFTHVT